MKQPQPPEDDMRQQRPAPTILRSYTPLCTGRASAVEPLDPAEADRLRQEEERCPSGQALACLWLDHQGQPSPVLVLEQGQDIASHLVRWAEGDPSGWFKLHVLGVGRYCAVALAPVLERAAE